MKGCQVGLRHVLNIDEVARLFTVAENTDVFTCRQGFGEYINDAALTAAALPFPVYIGLAENHIFEAEYLIIHLQILFRNDLGKTVERCRRRRFVFLQGDSRIIAVHGGG